MRYGSHSPRTFLVLGFVLFGACGKKLNVGAEVPAGGAPDTAAHETPSDGDGTQRLEQGAGTPAALDPGKIALEMISEWRSDCTTSPVSTGAIPPGGGFGAWSNPLVTSEWNGAPWSCLRARAYAESAMISFKVNFKSEHRSDCTTAPTDTGWSGGAGISGWSSPIVTSEWDGAPWSCLSAQVETPGQIHHQCRLRLQTTWSSACTTGAVSTGLLALDMGAVTTSAWTSWLVTSEWDGGPWSCLTAQLECGP